MAQAVALAAIVGMTASFGVGLAALVLRYRSRRIPGWLALAAIAAFGLANGTTFILFIRDWAILLGLLPIVAGLGYVLDRAGRRTWAGWLILTLGLPGMLWWGYFLLHDALSAAVRYEPVLWLWWAGPTTLVLIGLAIVLFGERPPPFTEFYPRQPSHARPPLALADALRRELGAPPIGLPQAVAGGAGIIVLVTLTTLGPLFDLPWPISWLLAAGAYALVATLLFYPAIPSATKEAWEGFEVASRPETERWRAVVGGRVPITPGAIRSWLASHPDRAELRPMRAEFLALHGDMEAARETAAQLPIDGPLDRIEQSLLYAYVDWLQGGVPDFEALRRQADATGGPGSQERVLARGLVAILVSRHLAATGGDWKAPLIAHRTEYGAKAASDMLRRTTYREQWRIQLGIGLLAAGLITAADLLVAMA